MTIRYGFFLSHDPDYAGIEAFHADLYGRGGSLCARTHAYRHAENDPGAGALQPRTLWSARSDSCYRFLVVALLAQRLCPHEFGRW
jgi:hypothetical protein